MGYDMEMDDFYDEEEFNEKELERLDKETDDAMLRQNPYFMEYKMKHEGGFIVPTDLQARIEEYKDNPNKFKRRVA